ncbi:2Fe-2S iron-sulfur cluster-binding protein [Crenobacter cavernae]|uniref:(2Fe-2S)-binding protein n=1 Tax=Crenobacter cavernae TaxID=2290923 RepID=A0ABY0F9Y2_9NEIS|nr:2Fe-2S iron-sulfur cluster-binding protein [Crenobacter cavernae]RXZ42072.1 (2Fe-2S)-binding protein [Crenobacter cavernae]
MPQIAFFDEAGEPITTLDAVAGDKLIDLAQFHGLPLHWRCGQGTCGTCRIKVGIAGAPPLPVGRLERNVLLREKLIDTAAAVSDKWPADGVRWRLACHVAVGDADLSVTLPSAP